jgi:hypothetical protein
MKKRKINVHRNTTTVVYTKYKKPSRKSAAIGRTIKTAVHGTPKQSVAADKKLSRLKNKGRTK